MKYPAILLILLFLLLSRNGFSTYQQALISFSRANPKESYAYPLSSKEISPGPLSALWRTKLHDNRRLIAACLAFPLPLGFLGAHRIFLGTSPYIPVAYVGTLGGCLGMIPFVDFWVIVFSKNFEQYRNNPKFFMWVK